MCLDVLNRGLWFAAIQVATGPQRFQIAPFELQGKKPLESLLRLYSFNFKIGFKSQIMPFDSLAI